MTGRMFDTDITIPRTDPYEEAVRVRLLRVAAQIDAGVTTPWNEGFEDAMAAAAAVAERRRMDREEGA